MHAKYCCKDGLERRSTINGKQAKQGRLTYHALPLGTLLDKFNSLLDGFTKLGNGSLDGILLIL